MVAAMILGALLVGGVLGALLRWRDGSRSSVTSRSIDSASLDAQSGFRGMDGPP